METIGTWWMWTGFAVFVVVAIAIDLLLVMENRRAQGHDEEAAGWSVIWFSLAFQFVGWLWWYLDGSQGDGQYHYRVDAVHHRTWWKRACPSTTSFVFLMIFSYFAVPAEYQKRALIVGIIAAIAARHP